MTTMILLSAADATHVQGPSAERPTMASLIPLPLTDGRYYLPVSVLTDPDHAEFWAYLAALTQADYATVIVPLLPAGKL